MSNCRFFSSSPTYVSFDDVSGWYGSRTGADDLWVLPKPEPRSFTLGHQPCCGGSVAADHGIQTRVPMLPYALQRVESTSIGRGRDPVTVACSERRKRFEVPTLMRRSGTSVRRLGDGIDPRQARIRGDATQGQNFVAVTPGLSPARCGRLDETLLSSSIAHGSTARS
jgi:hypothetical protein